MRLGLIVRADNRGLGNLTWEAARHLNPDAILIVNMGPLGFGGYEPGRYADLAPRVKEVTFNGHYLHEADVRPWLADLDVIYSAETFYDWRIIEWAREHRTATVLHVMPEFYKQERQGLPAPTVTWAPTPWRLDKLPKDTRLVPVPVAMDRFPDRYVPYEPGEELRVLHPAGKLAMADRNGTRILLMVLRRVKRPMTVTVLSQDGAVPAYRQTNRNVTLNVVKGDRPHYWSGYLGQHLCVIPRQYGGLCLPAQEAAAAGLPLMMTDCPPNREFYPADLIPAGPAGAASMPSGMVPLYRPNPQELAARLDTIGAEELAELAWRSFAWAEAHSWDALRELWHAELERAWSMVH